MYSEPLSLIASFFGMGFAMSSYFVKKKNLFFVWQGGAILFLALSCLFKLHFLPTLTYVIALIRVVVYYLFEAHDKNVSIYLKTFFALLNVVAYFVLNAISGASFNAIEVLLIVASIMYAYVFGIRNIKLMRFIFIIPTVMCIVYYILTCAAIFLIISYSFELLANLTAICYYKYMEIKFNKAKIKK